MIDVLNTIDRCKLEYLLDKYNECKYMYNEYPHKSFWSNEFNEEDFKTSLKNISKNSRDVSQLFYVHIPFCKQQCLFCICNSIITNDYKNVKHYLENLFHEMDLLHKHINNHAIDINFKEIHIGGGTPTILNKDDFDELIAKIHNIVDMNNVNIFSLEIDPRRVTKDDLKYYNSKGINRLSFGVQDFDPDVQKAIKRIQPPELLENLLTPDIRKYFEKGINFDILCGLPKQTRESFKKTIDTVIKLSPDRIMLMFLTYSPDIKKHQKLMKKSEFPTLYEKIILFNDALQNLVSNGYVRIGLDHFAKPNDDLAKAMKENNVHWNTLGYRPGKDIDVIGVGTGSSGSVFNHSYFQNMYSLLDYESAISKDKFPIYRGYKMSQDDIIRHEIINKLRSYFFIDLIEFEQKHNLLFEEYFKNELISLDGFVKDGLVDISDKTIKITELGKLFTSHVCSIFDNYLRAK